jgi:O-acetylhomoserine/O-acetylserine sulfhydrylase-like pyridoxal-dependent enzyme
VGGLEAAKAFYDALKLVKRPVNIGDTRTQCCQIGFGIVGKRSAAH